jgi:hypothetical protein
MKSSRGVVLAGGGVLFFTEDGAGATITVSAVVELSSTGGSAEVIVVADEGAPVGVATGGGDANVVGVVGVVGAVGACGVARTAIVTPKTIMPSTASAHMIFARVPSFLGMTTVAFSCGAASSRREDGAGAADGAAFFAAADGLE